MALRLHNYSQSGEDRNPVRHKHLVVAYRMAVVIRSRLVAETDSGFVVAALHKGAAMALHTGSVVVVFRKDSLDWDHCQSKGLVTCRSPYICYRLYVLVNIDE
jgi:hypothetical protein